MLTKTEAFLVKDNLIGETAGDHCMKPVNPSSYNLFKTLARARGEKLEAETFAKILIECGQALIAAEQDDDIF